MGGVNDPIPGAKRTSVGGVTIDEVPAGVGRVKRVTYPPGWRWRTHMQPVTGTEWCTHAHVGFIAQGAIAVEYSDGCTTEYRAPTFVVVEPGHDGWVLGDDDVVLIQVDCGTETAERLGLAGEHRHT